MWGREGGREEEGVPAYVLDYTANTVLQELPRVARVVLTREVERDGSGKGKGAKDSREMEGCCVEDCSESRNFLTVIFFFFFGEERGGGSYMEGILEFVVVRVLRKSLEYLQSRNAHV